MSINNFGLLLDKLPSFGSSSDTCGFSQSYDAPFVLLILLSSFHMFFEKL